MPPNLDSAERIDLLVALVKTHRQCQTWEWENKEKPAVTFPPSHSCCRATAGNPALGKAADRRNGHVGGGMQRTICT